MQVRLERSTQIFKPKTAISPILSEGSQYSAYEAEDQQRSLVKAHNIAREMINNYEVVKT